MATLKVLYDYHRFGYTTFHTFAVNIVNAGIYAHTDKFATPPITQANYQIQLDKLTTAYDDYKTIGRSKKADFEIETNNTILLLDQLTDYVNALPNLTEELIDLSGFHHNKTTKTSSAIPGQVSVKSSKPLGNSVMQLSLNGDATALGYVVLVMDSATVPTNLTQINETVLIPGSTANNIIVSVSTNHLVTVNSLTVGSKYHVFVFAYNSIGSGPLSQPYVLISINP